MDQKLLIDTLRTMTVISGGLFAGYCLRRTGRSKPGWSPAINRFTLVWAQPVVMFLALWSMKTPDWRALALPVYSVVLIVVMWPIGALVSRLLHLDRSDTGSFTTAAIFSNQGFTYGTFLTFVALGTQGAALGSVYCISFMPMLFTFGFYVARCYSAEAGQGILKVLTRQFIDPQSRNPTLSILAGLALNWLHVPAPSSSAFIIDITMPASTAAFLFAIGLGLHLSAVRVYWRECVVLHALKYLVSPALGLLLAIPFGYWALADHSLLCVCFIMAATPSAIMSVLLAQVFHLNERLAGALFLTTNVTGIFLAPLILWLARLL